MFKKWRRKRALAKVKPGDGSALKPYRFWHPLTRSLFFLNLTDTDGRATEYAISYPYFADESRAELYRDGVQAAVSKLPAVFPVPGGVVEVAAGTFGLTRMHHVADDGGERALTPHRRSSEGLRARFGHRFPAISRLIGWAAIVILLVGLVVIVPQIVDWVTNIDYVAENIGSFTTPINLPNWANASLAVGGVLASLERALTLRNHWLIDAETWWLGD